MDSIDVFVRTTRNSSMKLYYSPGACSLSPHIVLHEAGLAHEAVRAATKTHKLDDGTDYYSINPLGYVPLLELDDGSRLREGPAIVQYLADLVPMKSLAPANGTLARYRLQEWLTFIGTEIHKTYSPLFNPNLTDEAKQVFRDKLTSRYKWIDGELNGKNYLMGEHFSVADAYFFTVTRWAEPLKLDLSAMPNVQAHHERVKQRPAVQAALKMEGLLK
jgi:glutathione S-transferase